MLDRISGDIMLSWGLKRFIYAFLAGVLLNLAFAPFDFFAVIFISFPILVWLLDGASGAPESGILGHRLPAFVTGWSFGFGYFTGGLWWLANAVLVSDEGAYWMLPFAIFGLPAVLALFFGGATAVARTVWSDNLGRIFALSASFGLFEYLRSVLFTGFPWNIIGYSAMPIPVAMQSAEIVGIFGMSIVIVFIASIPALIATKRGLRTGCILASFLVVLHIGYGTIVLSGADVEMTSDSVRLVQPSIDQSSKWDDSKRSEIFQTYLRLTQAPHQADQEQPNLVIWPETSVPYILTKAPEVLGQISQKLNIGQVLLTGAVKFEEGIDGEQNRYFNSIYAINDEGQILGSSDKVHLVPFGEYLPFEKLARSIGLIPLAESFGGYSAAPRQTSITLPNGLRILPLICYEAIFPSYSGNSEVGADVIVNVTNDAWYGDTPGPYQHLRQAQIRAVESGLPLIRVANNGISVITDNRGQIISGMNLNHVGIIDHKIPSNRTPFIQSRARFIIFMAILAFFFLISFLIRNK